MADARSVLRIVAADATFTNAFWNTTRTSTDVFTNHASNPIADWADAFTTISVVNSSFTPITPGVGSFPASGSTFTWTVIPGPSSALVSLLIGAGLLRAAGEWVDIASCDAFPSHPNMVCGHKGG